MMKITKMKSCYWHSLSVLDTEMSMIQTQVYYNPEVMAGRPDWSDY